jgi:hypothetical protein
MLLYEIYGKDLFKITRYEIDILRYRPKSVILAAMAGGGSSIGGYIEDGDGTRTSPEEPDFRVNIPLNSNETNETNEPGILISGMKWLFG